MEKRYERHLCNQDVVEKTLLNLDKIHAMAEHACRGLAGVSESQVEMNANLQFFDGIKTSDIQEILIRSANDLISLDAPNYQFVAARLLLFGLRKAVYGGHPDGHLHGLEHVKKCVDLVWGLVFSISILMKSGRN